MKCYARGVFGRTLGRLGTNQWLSIGGVAALAAGVFFAVGFARSPRPAPGADPIVSTMAPVSDSTIAPLLALDRATEAVAHQVTPAVVNIEVVGRSSTPEGGGMGGPAMPQQLPGPFQQFFFPGPYRAQPQVFEALGTGVIISPDGYIVTNNHVVAGATHIEVTLHDKRQFVAKVVGRDKPTDLAVIKIDATGLTSAAWGDSADLQPGETVLAIGDPLGMDFSVTRGIVSAVNRSRTMADGPDARGVFIQTDAAINHGNSGGPLVDARGEVVGINAEMLTTSGASAGIGFAIPSDIVRPVAEQLIEHGKVVRGYLGIDVTDLDPNVASSLNEAGTRGALVNQVNPGSPAAAAGIEPYDVVTGLNGHPVRTGSDLQALAGAAAPGSKAMVQIMRDGKALSLPVIVGNLADANAGSAGATAGPGSGAPKLGMEVGPLTPEARNQYQLPPDVHGVVVESVTPGSPAMVAGIANGDVIEQVNRQPVASVAELEAQLRNAPAGKDILLLVHKASGNFILPVNPQY